jgi:hypothetical protein
MEANVLEPRGPQLASGGDQRFQLLSLLVAGLDEEKQLGVKNILLRFFRLTPAQTCVSCPTKLCNKV